MTIFHKKKLMQRIALTGYRILTRAQAAHAKDMSRLANDWIEDYGRTVSSK
jgi:hypothetical protein